LPVVSLRVSSFLLSLA